MQSHLDLRARGDLEQDIQRNYAEHLVLFHANGKEFGHAGIRKSGIHLLCQFPDSHFCIKHLDSMGPYAYLEWEAESKRYSVVDGADSFVIDNEKIVMQTVHYRLLPRQGGGSEPTESAPAAV